MGGLRPKNWIKPLGPTLGPTRSPPKGMLGKCFGKMFWAGAVREPPKLEPPEMEPPELGPPELEPPELEPPFWGRSRGVLGFSVFVSTPILGGYWMRKIHKNKSFFTIFPTQTGSPKRAAGDG